VRTASGATAVQIVESVDGRRRIVRHVGSAHDEAKFGALVAEADALLADDRQGVLDLGLQRTHRAAACAVFDETASDCATRATVRCWQTSANSAHANAWRVSFERGSATALVSWRHTCPHPVHE